MCQKLLNYVEGRTERRRRGRDVRYKILLKVKGTGAGHFFLKNKQEVGFRSLAADLAMLTNRFRRWSCSKEGN